MGRRFKTCKKNCACNRCWRHKKRRWRKLFFLGLIKKMPYMNSWYPLKRSDYMMNKKGHVVPKAKSRSAAKARHFQKWSAACFVARKVTGERNIILKKNPQNEFLAREIYSYL